MLRTTFLLLCLFAATFAVELEDIPADSLVIDDSLALDIHELDNTSILPSVDRMTCKNIRLNIKSKKVKCGKNLLQIFVRTRIAFMAEVVTGEVTIKCRGKSSALKKAVSISKCLKKNIPKCKCKKGGKFLKCLRNAFRKCSGKNKVQLAAPTVEP